MKSGRLSLYAWIFTTMGILLIGFLYYPRWQKDRGEATLSYDIAGYYAYLPAAFIYHDLRDMRLTEQKAGEYQNNFIVTNKPDGTRITKYASGWAVLHLPPFLIAHALAKPLGYPQDGYSLPYQAAISWWGLLVSIIGFWFLRKLLLRFFLDKTVAVLLIVLYFGTNYLNQCTVDIAYTHNSLFTLYVFLVLLTEKYHRTPSILGIIKIGIVIGLMSLTRPTELIAILIPMMWGIGSYGGMKERIGFIFSKWSHVVLSGLIIGAIGMLQLFYWKYATGEWIQYSYEEEGFDFLSPHIYDSIFSYKKGWWVYTPIMAFIVPGFILLWKRKDLFWPVGLYSLLFMYIAFSWQTWWYGGSMSQRAVVQLYPLLAFPLSAFIEYISRKKSWVHAVFVFIAMGCIYFNFWLTYQAHHGGQLHPERMTKAYYWKVLLRSKANPDHKALLDNKDYYDQPVVHFQSLLTLDFEQDSIGICQEHPLAGKNSFCLRPDGPSFPVIQLDNVPKDKKWIRVEALVQGRPKEWNEWLARQLILEYYHNRRVIKANMIRVDNLLHHQDIKQIKLDSKIPNEAFDHVILRLIQFGTPNILAIDDISVIAFDP